MKPLLVSSGEPAGVGPDLCLALAHSSIPVVVIGDQCVLEERASLLNQQVKFKPYESGKIVDIEPGFLTVLNVPCPNPVACGQLSSNNSRYVVELLTRAAILCGQGEFSGLVTAPVHKAIINEAGIPFTGHTEFLSQFFNVDQVVMMLACKTMKVALVTTHLPLSKVSESITGSLILNVVKLLHHSLIHDFSIPNPRIKVAGLNPHAGESGHLGCEEIETISPAIVKLKQMGLQVEGPFPADTMYINDSDRQCDAYVAMYHDQGLPIIKYIGFNEAVNVTLGLPIIRTSVDHGTALDLAGKGLADPGSLFAAVKMAGEMVMNGINSCQ